jgi:hypothetical protein
MQPKRKSDGLPPEPPPPGYVYDVFRDAPPRKRKTNKNWFRIQRKSDRLFYNWTKNAFTPSAVKVRASKLPKVLRWLRDRKGVDMDDLLVTRIEVLTHPPRAASEMLVQIEEALEKDWPLWWI